MANYAQDTFTDIDGTLLSAHTPNSGGSYAVFSDGIIESNSATNTSFGNSLVGVPATPASADYQVSGTFIASSGGPDFKLYLGLRVGAVGTFDGYYAGWDNGSSEWKIVTLLSFSETTLVSTASSPLVASSSVPVVFSVVGTSLTLNVGGTDILTTTDVTFSSTGTAAIQTVSTIQSWLSLDNLSVDDVGGGGGGGPLVLTGRGNVAITTPAWLSVALTGIPALLTSGQAEPPNWYHAGMLSWGTANGAITAHPVTRELELIELPAGMDTLWYEFNPSITATITQMSSP